MILWRLSDAAFADALDGGYGQKNSGRWNSIGKLVTYASSSPALCILEKLAHIEDPDLVPDLVMVEYDVPDNLAVTDYGELGDLPWATWRHDQELTKKLGDKWYDEKLAPLLTVPSAIAFFKHTPDMNFVINNSHAGAAGIQISSKTPYSFDPRLVE